MPVPGGGNTQPSSIHELDLVNGGDDIQPGNSGASGNSNAQAAGPEGEGNEEGGDGYDLC